MFSSRQRLLGNFRFDTVLAVLLECRAAMLPRSIWFVREIVFIQYFPNVVATDNKIIVGEALGSHRG
jgi:hypothetical protein